jgi:hypothetical protein
LCILMTLIDLDLSVEWLNPYRIKQTPDKSSTTKWQIVFDNDFSFFTSF